ncbi:hypothetical protein SE17_24485 [Kouleothrix aurantiaca]|jgi:hypothetical protein|uniref:Uncharacterized protein n=1 Tax=Kouleothrix aurantiaca TaxID=186479 RepID=A0A0N8PRU0_9CHLR|nr:hypothetical protein SE17_24485 [Kouleothrix aurantiaca]
MGENQNTTLMWLGGVVIALLLIVISTRAGGGLNNPVLIQKFAPRPTDPNAPPDSSFQLPQVNLPSLPPAIQQQVTSLRDRLLGGQAVPALTPVATGPRARVQVGQVKRSGDHLQINGTVTNISSAALTIPPGAFSFRDSRGISYATTTSGGTTLQPNQSTSFDLGVPVSSDRGLTLVLMLPPDPPLEQILVIEAVP